MNHDFERLRRLNRVSARLLFDTADHPASQGIRGGEADSRHLLYEVEQLCLDLRLDYASLSSQTVLVGQLADRHDPLKPMTDVPVFLLAGDKVLANTVSNRQGEFQMQYEPDGIDSGGVVAVCMPVGEDRLIEVPVS